MTVGDRVRFRVESEFVTGDVLHVRATHLVVRVLTVRDGRLRAFRYFVQPSWVERVVLS